MSDFLAITGPGSTAAAKGTSVSNGSMQVIMPTRDLALAGSPPPAAGSPPAALLPVTPPGGAEETKAQPTAEILVPLSTDKLPALEKTPGAAAVNTPVVDTAGAAASALAAAPVAVQEDQDEEDALPLRPRQLPKAGRISFNIKGAKTAMAAAKAQVEAEEAVAAVRARRLNFRDASTQTVRDPESQDGDIVTIWRLRPRGMESFPHFPRQPAKKKARGSTVTATGLALTAAEDGAIASRAMEDDEEPVIQAVLVAPNAVETTGSQDQEAMRVAHAVSVVTAVREQPQAMAV